MHRFALIGAAGYIAPRHMRAIKDTGNDLVATLDPYDGMGVIDDYFPQADYFTESERFDRHLDKLRRNENTRIHYLSICSPNYLHDAHIRMALRNDAHAICEKPLVLNPWNVEALERLEQESKRQINVILQLRLHPAIQALHQKINTNPSPQKHEVDLSYITSRGKWYQWSWKGKPEKSGGVATNIGVHFFDMLSWVFGPSQNIELHYQDRDTVGGIIAFEKANVKWMLSLDEKYLPEVARQKGQRSFREMQVDGELIDFSEGFTDLHTESYRRIIDGNGFRPADARSSIQIVYEMRNLEVRRTRADIHPILAKLI